MVYKDMTFCPGPCETHNCFRHKDRVYKDENAIKFREENPWMPVSWFVHIPKDCPDKT